MANANHSKLKDVVVPHHVLDNAAVALRRLGDWIENTTFIKSPITRAMLASATRARISAEAALRMAERANRGFHPQSSGELHAWLTIEETLGAMAREDRNPEQAFLAMQRQAWSALPEGWDRWSTEEAEQWTRAVLASPPLPQNAMHWMSDEEPEPVREAIETELERAREDEMHRRGER